MSELINKIKTQIEGLLNLKVGGLTIKDSLSQIDSRASAIPIAAVITVFLFFRTLLSKLGLQPSKLKPWL